MWGACEDLEGALPLLGEWKVGGGRRWTGEKRAASGGGAGGGAHQILNYSFTVGYKSFTDTLLVGRTTNFVIFEPRDY